ncbi:MAG: hypothetical protein RKL24_03600 [Defluviicoccus sp.]|nr:hypothetical protein [Defluviicoccus sp.]
MLTRRQFLKVGVVGSAGLAALGALYWAHERSQADVAAFKLDVTGREIVAALAPAILAGALPEDGYRAAAVERVVDGVEQAVAGLSASAQGEVRQLFALLGFAPTRILLGGVTVPWREARAADAAAFLERWRFSRFDLLQSAYAALHDLVLGAWYGGSDAWETIGYPGPPEVL